MLHLFGAFWSICTFGWIRNLSVEVQMYIRLKNPFLGTKAWGSPAPVSLLACRTSNLLFVFCFLSSIVFTGDLSYSFRAFAMQLPILFFQRTSRAFCSSLATSFRISHGSLKRKSRCILWNKVTFWRTWKFTPLIIKSFEVKLCLIIPAFKISHRTAWVRKDLGRSSGPDFKNLLLHFPNSSSLVNTAAEWKPQVQKAHREHRDLKKNLSNSFLPQLQFPHNVTSSLTTSVCERIVKLLN